MQSINNFIFTFRNKCNMNCKFCFIPFVDKSIGNLNLWKEIIDYLFKFNPQMITFGGGDPFIFPGKYVYWLIILTSRDAIWKKPKRSQI